METWIDSTNNNGIDIEDREVVNNSATTAAFQVFLVVHNNTATDGSGVQSNISPNNESDWDISDSLLYWLTVTANNIRSFDPLPFDNDYDQNGQTIRDKYSIYAISTLDMVYSLNNIPTCSVTVPIGIDVAGITAMNILETEEILKSKIPSLLMSQPRAKVFLRQRITRLEYNDNGPLVAGEQGLGWTSWKCIFDGYIIKSIINKNSTANYSFSLTLTHWVIDLNTSPVINSLIHPLSNTDYSLTAFTIMSPGSMTPALATDAPDNMQIDFNFLNFLNSAAQSDSVTGGLQASFKSQMDLWGSLLFKYYYRLVNFCEQSTKLKLNDNIDTDFISVNNPLNALNHFAMNRATYLDNQKAISGTSLQYEAPPNAGLSSRYSYPLIIPDSMVTAQTGIVSFLNTISQVSISQSTLWSILIKHSSDFSFAVIPLPDAVFIQPYDPGCRTPFAVICNAELVSISKITNRPIAASIVTWPKSAPNTNGVNTSVGLPTTSYSTFVDIGGTFIPLTSTYDKDSFYKGSVIVNQPPQWLSQIWSSPPSNVIKYATDKLDTETTTGQYTEQEAADQKQTNSAIAELYGRLAKSYYYKTITANQTMAVQTPLNFSIAPGSTVEVSLGNQSEIEKAGDLDYIGTVTSVTVKLSVIEAVATTQYNMMNVRSRNLNDLPSFSTDEHPIYQNADLANVQSKSPMFNGMSLIDLNENNNPRVNNGN